MKKYFNFLISFLATRSSGLLLGVILYQLKGPNEWAYYAMFLTYVGMFRNTTLNFTSNLGHEGLRLNSQSEYTSLFALVGSIIVSLQLVAFPFVYWATNDSVILLSCAYSIIMSLQSLIQNYYRYRFEYEKYGKSSFIFATAPLLTLILFWLYDIEIYLLSLVFINAMYLFLYKKAILSIANSFSLGYARKNIWSLTKSSLKLFIIRLPDSYFFVYFVLIEKGNLSDTGLAVLVYLIALTAIDKYPLLTPRVQENMDIIKSSSKGAIGNSVAPIFQQLKYIIPLIYGYLIVEISYITFIAEEMSSIIAYFPLIVGYILLIVWRYSANAAVELEEKLVFKIFPVVAGIATHMVLYHLDYRDSLFRFFAGGSAYLVLYFIKYKVANRDREKGSARYLWMILLMVCLTWLLNTLVLSSVFLSVSYLIICLITILSSYKSYFNKVRR